MLDLILEKNKDELPDMLSVDENNVLIIPKGYAYCGDCNAITPHVNYPATAFRRSPTNC